MPSAGPPTLALLEEDPELAAAVPEDELEHARRVLRVPALTLEVGSWDVNAAAPEPLLGLLVIDGLVTVNVVLRDRVASQLVGPGDVLHRTSFPDALLPAVFGHFVSERARVAVLDERFIAAVRRWPGLLLALLERLRVQESRLAVLAAVGKLRRVEERLLALLWHLAERWGRVTPDGVVVPLALTHETLGRLSGAERPTITLALQELARAGQVVRRADGAFVMREETRALLRPDAEGRPQVRPLAVTRTADAPDPQSDDPAARPMMTDRAALSRRIEALRANFPERTRDAEEVLSQARTSIAASASLRERVAADRAARRND